jgi:mRNA interferase RelE/StbE
MTARVVITPQVRHFLQSLAPQPRRKLWRAIKSLAHDQGDIKQLDGKLARYWRLRVDQMRVIFDRSAAPRERRVVCFFANYRATVYAILEQLLASGLIEELKRN